MVSDSLRLHELQHVRLPCPSLSPGVCSNSCPSSRWCQPTISSSVIPFSSCLQSFPASGSFLMSRLFCRFSIIPVKYQWTFLGFCCSCFVFQNYTECQVFRALTSFVNDLFLLFSFPMIYFMFSGPSFFQRQWMEFQLFGLKKITAKSQQNLKEQTVLLPLQLERTAESTLHPQHTSLQGSLQQRNRWITWIPKVASVPWEK